MANATTTSGHADIVALDSSGLPRTILPCGPVSWGSTGLPGTDNDFLFDISPNGDDITCEDGVYTIVNGADPNVGFDNDSSSSQSISLTATGSDVVSFTSTPFSITSNGVPVGLNGNTHVHGDWTLVDADGTCATDEEPEETFNFTFTAGGKSRPSFSGFSCSSSDEGAGQVNSTPAPLSLEITESTG